VSRHAIPTYGLPALWIAPEQREAAASARYTLVDPETGVPDAAHRGAAARVAPCSSRAARPTASLGRVRQGNPRWWRSASPPSLSLGDVQKVLQNLLREKVSIRHIEAILETLADAGRTTKDPAR
jgi:flagellar biosynthesis protein FlhA